MCVWRDRIVCDPDILVGKPTVKGTRISVEQILGWLANGWTNQQILEAYPHICPEDIQATLAFAAQRLREDDYVPLPTLVACPRNGRGKGH